MFTGIIEVKGRVRGWRRAKGAVDILEIEAARVSKNLKIGGSLAVNGACLTVTKKRGTHLFFNLVKETKKRTALQNLKPGDPVNLERPLSFGQRMEGHFVLGHVDGVGEVRKVLSKGGEKSFLISFPHALKPYMVEKGSVAVDGVSLTLGKVKGGSFWIHCIPHTLRHTLFGSYQVGSRVNLEADIIAKLVLTTRGRHYKL